VAGHDLLESVAASLTELFAGDIMAERIAAFETHYPWVKPEGLAYFRSRTRQAPADARQGLRFVLEHARTPGDEERCVAALERKCEILWQLLDAVEAACAQPRRAAHALLRAEPGGGALVVLPERAVRLDARGSEILELCDGRRSAEAIAAQLASRHRGAPGVEDDVHDFLAQMERAGVLERAARSA
jgi:coenzyme PQQ biosynthesis protein PqqD